MRKFQFGFFNLNSSSKGPWFWSELPVGAIATGVWLAGRELRLCCLYDSLSGDAGRQPQKLENRRFCVLELLTGSIELNDNDRLVPVCRFSEAQCESEDGELEVSRTQWQLFEIVGRV